MAATDKVSDALANILSQASTLAKDLNEASRKKLIDGLRDLAVSLETPQDTMQRLLYCDYPLTAVRMGCDLKLFTILKDAGQPLTVEQLAKQTGAAPALLGRLLRYMASVQLISETAKDTFTGNNVSEVFANPGIQGGVYHNHDFVGPGIRKLPDYLKKRGYQDVNNALDTSHQEAWGYSIPAYEYYPTQPELFGHFQQFMTVQRWGLGTWLEVYPYKEAAAGLGPEQPFFVDVGGGFGHQTLAIREALPELPNKFINQDLPPTLAMPPTVKHPGIENMAADFWKPQPVKGAKVYYLRNILHNYPDEKAIQILKNTKEALGPESVILLDEMYLPNSGVHWQATQLDLTMMASLGAVERSEAQWEAIITKAGLKIRNVFTYTQTLRDSVIECVPA